MLTHSASRSRAVCVAVGILAFSAVSLLDFPPVVRAGGEPAASENGDVNGDSSLDISDVVYTLVHLFKGGPGPVGLADNPELLGRIAQLEGDLSASREEVAELQTMDASCRDSLQSCRLAHALPATGQVQCFDGSGVAIPCNGREADLIWPGQDGELQAGCSFDGRFVDNNDGTIMDNCTGLMWQKATARPETKYLPGTCGAGLGCVDWSNALMYCDELIFAGHDDWRMPNVRELQSLVDYGRCRMFDPIFGIDDVFYWSSTSGRCDSLYDYALAINFTYADFGLRSKRNESNYVLAVRRP